MSEMVDRVAEAIWQAEAVRTGFRERRVAWTEVGPESQNTYLPLARAVIKAMREPTAQMLASVAPLAMVAPDLDCYDLAAEAIALLPQNDNPYIADVLAQMVQDHRAMIDEALK